MRAGFEGGQMPIYMRLGKQRGATSKDAMPIGPFRTSTAPINVSALDRFDDGAEVTPESLVEKGLLKNTKTDVKLLGNGDLEKKLTVRVHAISATAREKVEKAGGTVSLLKEPKVKKQKHSKPKSKPAAAEPQAPEAEAVAVAEAPANDQAEQPASEEE
jgi:ribosomal protein L15